MSDEYTPTTEEVRTGYIGQPADHFMDPLIGAEFDRWLAKHDAEVRVKYALEQLEIKVAKLEADLDNWDPTG